jgi:hypothetical protein
VISSTAGTYFKDEIQAPSVSRSSSVIPVAFPSGIAFERTACSSTASACDLISSSVSKAIPAGGAEKPGSLGFCE